MKPKALHLEEWGKGKHQILVMFAHEVALSAEDCYMTCRMARQGERIDGEECNPPLARWLELYRDDGRFISTVIHSVFPHQRDLVGLASVAREKSELAALGERLRERLERRRVTLREFIGWGHDVSLETNKEYQRHIASVRRSLEGRAYVPTDWRQRLESPEALFFCRVWLPCWIEYGVPLPVLWRRACGGELDALDKLFRLDKLILDDPEIRARYLGTLEGAKENEGRVFRRLTDALNGKPDYRSLTLQRVKVSLGALVHRTSVQLDAAFKEMNRKLKRKRLPIRYPKVKFTAPQVRGLFNAAAQDEYHMARDRDLPRNDHTLYVALRRDWKFWGDFSGLRVSHNS